MDLYEYQAKDLFQAHGVPVARGNICVTWVEARKVAKKIGVFPVVLKAQVKVGGRGKLGGVKSACNLDEAEKIAKTMLGSEIRGHVTHSILVLEGVHVEEEFYFSIFLDRSAGTHIALCSKEGGVEIEQTARKRPETVARVELDPFIGVNRCVASAILGQAGFCGEIKSKLLPVLVSLWEMYKKEDATMVEVNPIALTKQGDIVALDAKVTLDDNAAFRQEHHATFEDNQHVDPRQVVAQKMGLKYVRLDGNVGVVGNGAGLVMSTLDVVAVAGEKYGVKPANFLDIGGGASAQAIAVGLEILLDDARVRSVLVNVFGGITACDEVARGIDDALKALKNDNMKPVVVRLGGNRMEEGNRILANNTMVTVVDTMNRAAEVAVRFAANVKEGE